jgi:hypothetical protein
VRPERTSRNSGREQIKQERKHKAREPDLTVHGQRKTNSGSGGQNPVSKKMDLTSLQMKSYSKRDEHPEQKSEDFSIATKHDSYTTMEVTKI